MQMAATAPVISCCARLSGDALAAPVDGVPTDVDGADVTAGTEYVPPAEATMVASEAALVEENVDET